jgi:hypothetical protein
MMYMSCVSKQWPSKFCKMSAGLLPTLSVEYDIVFSSCGERSAHTKRTHKGYPGKLFCNAYFSQSFILKDHCSTSNFGGIKDCFECLDELTLTRRCSQANRQENFQ